SAAVDAYLLERARRGQEPAWSFETLTGGLGGADALAEEAAERHRQRTVAATEVDAVFYLKANTDVADAGAHAPDHYRANGRRQGHSVRPLPGRRPGGGPQRPRRARLPLRDHQGPGAAGRPRGGGGQGLRTAEAGDRGGADPRARRGAHRLEGSLRHLQPRR